DRRMVALFGRADLAKDIGDGGSVPSFTLGQVFNTTEEVDAAVAAMAAAGAKVRKPPQRAVFFPGYHAYVEAADETVWEFVQNPGSQLEVGPIDSSGTSRAHASSGTLPPRALMSSNRSAKCHRWPSGSVAS